ncbi:M20/M25/M40 family metallo-hydrolase [Luteimonas aquatica]|uniref:M20/M25/M40 family metallo-hydrolase n=1 Tax=Luteimonas aquatica TaxID=450364 RepID=UPI001F5ACBF7|nr:M20/M25/M40 family metallo-hydrolase [Luteimonas aquatica]
MKPLHTLTTFLAAAMLSPLGAAAHGGAVLSPASAPSGEDAMASVYLVSSDATYRTGIRSSARNSLARKDSLGNALVISEVKAHQLPSISETVHSLEKRCGGYFAFDTQAEAEAFIRSDRTAQAIQRQALVSYTIDNQATVDPWLPLVQASNILGTISHLSTSYNNRYYATTTGQQSANWIRDTWAGLANGRSDASAALFTSCGNCSTQPSVILTIQGNELSDEIVVLGAHLDSISSSGSGSSMNAPGADDDASGIATLTEVIRVALASGWKPKRTVMFMGYAAEEVGLRGSNAIAQSFKTQGKNVVGVLQLDMTNYKVGTGVDMQLITDNSNAALKQFLTDLFDEYLQPLGLTRGTYTCGYGCSDHASWTSAGFPAAMMFEAGDESGEYFPYIHSSSDTLSNMGNSAANSAKFAKLGLAFLGELGKTSGGGSPGNQAPVADFSVTTSGLSANFTNASTDSDGSIASYQWDFGDGGSATTASPAHTYASAGTYSAKLTVTDDDGASHSRTRSVTVSGGSGAQTYRNDSDYAIADYATVNSPIAVSGRSGNAPSATQVQVDIKHPYIGDLKVDVVAPDGSVYVLHNRTGSSTDNILKTYSVNLSSEALNGTWNLRVRDGASGDTGKIDSWAITF